MNGMTSTLALILAPLTLLTFALAIELFVGLRPLSRPVVGQVKGVRVTIIVPAHDEAPILDQSLAMLTAAASGLADILLIADNCTDSTANIARLRGVEVVERFDAANRGKGFALDCARGHLQGNPPGVVLVIDADCAIDSQSLERLVTYCATSGRPCQAIYLQEAVPHGPTRLQLSTFAFYIKNVVRQRALFRLAGRVHLHGSGMAIPWSLFECAKLGNSNIVEDLEMGLEFTSMGHPPLMVEEALVLSKPAILKETIEQRRRWEGGFLASAAKWAPSILLSSIRDRQLRELWAAIDLLVPPFALLLLMDVLGLTFGTLAWASGLVQVWPAVFLLLALCSAGAGLLGAWASGGSRFVRLSSLLKLPLYLLWKIPLYIWLARHGAPKEWVRTRRD
jgi:glycosyltransferase involved in cell wall biosynthesis